MQQSDLQSSPYFHADISRTFEELRYLGRRSSHARIHHDVLVSICGSYIKQYKHQLLGMGNSQPEIQPWKLPISRAFAPQATKIPSVVGISLTLSCWDLLLFGGQFGVARVYLVCMVRGHVTVYVGGSSRARVQGLRQGHTLRTHTEKQATRIIQHSFLLLFLFSISRSLCQ